MSDLPIRRPLVKKDNRSAFHLYVIRIPKVEQSRSRLEVFEMLRTGGVNANLHYLPVHLQPYYRRLGFSEGAYPEAEAYSQEAITLPLYPTLHDDQQSQVISLLKSLWQ